MSDATRCPVCGGEASEVLDEFKVCVDCREILYPRELVPVATEQTRLTYARANGHPDDYGTPNEGADR